MIIRALGYSILFLINMALLNFDHATPGADESVVEAPFWAMFQIAYAIGMTIAIAGWFEKISDEKSGATATSKNWLVASGIVIFLIGFKLESDSGYMQFQHWYNYLHFFLFIFFIVSIYFDMSLGKKNQ